MRKSQFTETEIVYAVKQVEAGVLVAEVARKYGVSLKTIYAWRAKYGGLSVSEVARLKQLEDEAASSSRWSPSSRSTSKCCRTSSEKNVRPAVRRKLVHHAMTWQWSLDFMADQLATGQRIRILTALDHFSRECEQVTRRRVSFCVDHF
jgi:putative transposase